VDEAREQLLAGTGFALDQDRGRRVGNALDQVEERLNLIHNLKRKYGKDIPAVLAFAEESHRQLDAITHEYMHYLIVRSTANKAPIWFHEGLSKYEETRWRNGPSYLSSLYQSLLSRALADGKLISFALQCYRLNFDPAIRFRLTPDSAAWMARFLCTSGGTRTINLPLYLLGDSGQKQ
jgi:hypothetical protein